jgi:hypothetical protein
VPPESCKRGVVGVDSKDEEVGEWVAKRSALYDQPYWEHSVSRQQTWTRPAQLDRVDDNQGVAAVDHAQQIPRTESSKSVHDIWDSIAASDNDTLYTTADTAGNAGLAAAASVDASFGSSNLSLTSDDEDAGALDPANQMDEGHSIATSREASAEPFTFAADHSPSLSSIDELAGSSGGDSRGASGSGSDLGLENKSADVSQEAYCRENNDEQVSWTPPGLPPSLQIKVGRAAPSPPPRTASADRRLVSMQHLAKSG